MSARVKISQFVELEFEKGSRPALSTVRRWIEGNKLPGGEKIGSQYYVDLDVWRARGNPLVLKVLRAA